MAAEQRLAVGAADMRGRAEGRGRGDARRVAQLRGQPVGARPGGDEGDQAGLLDDLVGRAARHQLAIGDVGDLVTALGLVHVVGRDQHGDALGGVGMDLVPEGAPRLGIDAGRRLVEQQQLAARAARRRRAPAAASSRPTGDPASWFWRVARPEPLERVVDALLQPVEAVDAADELEVLADGEILVEAEALGHVAGLALDRLALAHEVVAEAGAAAAVGRQQAADHAQASWSCPSRWGRGSRRCGPARRRG